MQRPRHLRRQVARRLAQPEPHRHLTVVRFDLLDRSIGRPLRHRRRAVGIMTDLHIRGRQRPPVKRLRIRPVHVLADIEQHRRRFRNFPARCQVPLDLAVMRIAVISRRHHYQLAVYQRQERPDVAPLQLWFERRPTDLGRPMYLQPATPNRPHLLPRQLRQLAPVVALPPHQRVHCIIWYRSLYNRDHREIPRWLSLLPHLLLRHFTLYRCRRGLLLLLLLSSRDRQRTRRHRRLFLCAPRDIPPARVVGLRSSAACQRQRADPYPCP